MANPPSQSKPRSLADDLRSRSESELTHLFLGRPDLAHPTPADITGLARRATAAPSVSRALDQLSAPQLHVLFCLRDAPLSMESLKEVADSKIISDVPSIVQSLREIGLIWGHPESITVVTTVRESLTESLADIIEPPVMSEKSSAKKATQDLDAQAGLHAHNFLSLVHDSLYVFRTTPLTALRTGGISSREVDRLADFLAISESETVLLLEVMHGAGLIALTTSLQWEVTTKYDSWRTKSKQDQWVVLSQAWLDLPLVGSATKKPLSNATTTPAVGVMRWQTLRALQWWNAQTTASADKEFKQFIAALDHLFPRRRGKKRNEIVKDTFREAEWLGITHAGVVCRAGCDVVQDHDSAAAKELQLPKEVEYFLIQGDLTVTAPGPLPLEVGEKLHAIANIESRGAASVYRFDAESIRSGYHTGWCKKDFIDFLSKHSKGELPQPLVYLIDDCESSATTVEETANRATIPPKLGRHSRRVTEKQAQRIAHALLQGNNDPIDMGEPAEVYSLNTSALVALLKSAQEHHTGVWIGYAEADGSTSTQIVEPIRMGDGTLTAFDHGTANVRTFSISRVTGIAPARFQETGS